ncbi:ankyrin repeat domain-containing protein [Chitinilyticum piscinae]|uniref:Ankyrin repeat domain-containing protein n=1 Tax=Chitinilyticum piscinae TaxID=2866724 RepID=A0A8J7FQ84_9NEIS|nr:ankyrin repeat domain-containing protein [Chitinilyticum piscinae]MBE9610259.1 ankyrin repeat domain-containing protein [Chitinilyticum piscinae]
MNDNLLHLLGGDEAQYPHALGEKYPRIIERLVSLWGTPDVLVYLNGLIFDQRGGREGFPEDAAKDLFHLNDWIRSHMTEAMKQQAAGRLSHFDDVWETAEMLQGEKRSNEVAMLPETLLEAGQRGDIEAIRKHLDAGLGINNIAGPNEQTVLHGACGYGHAHCVESILRLGGQVGSKDAAGRSPLHLAAQAGSADSIELLLAAGADINTVDKEGQTPLHHAVQSGKMRSVVQLLEAGAALNVQDVRQNAPLHLAVLAKQSRMVELLLSYGAERTLVNADGHTPLELALMSSDTRLPGLF